LEYVFGHLDVADVSAKITEDFSLVSPDKFRKNLRIARITVAQQEFFVRPVSDSRIHGCCALRFLSGNCHSILRALFKTVRKTTVINPAKRAKVPDPLNSP